MCNNGSNEAFGEKVFNFLLSNFPYLVLCHPTPHQTIVDRRFFPLDFYSYSVCCNFRNLRCKKSKNENPRVKKSENENLRMKRSENKKI